MAYYAQQDPSFPGTMEGRFLHALLEACEAGDVAALDAAVQQNDRVKPIVGWQAGLIRAVRKAVADEPDLA